MPGLLAASAVALVAVTVASVAVAGRGSSPANPAASATATTAVSDSSLLVSLRDEGQISSAQVQGFRQGGSAAGVLLPSRLILDVRAGGSRPLSQLAEETVVQPISDALGVRIDAAWSLQRLALAGLVDAVDGIVVITDVSFVRASPTGVTEVITPGEHRLNGLTAAAYATYLGVGEDESARLARFSAVLNAAILALPSDPKQVAEIVASLGSTSRVSLTIEQLTDRLLAWQEALRTDRSPATKVPTTEIPLGSIPAYRVAPVLANALMDRDFGTLRLRPGPASPTRVLLRNASGTLGATIKVRQTLEQAGFVVLTGAAADATEVSTSVVVPREADREIAAPVATALSLDDQSIAVAAPATVADVTVVIGEDLGAATVESPSAPSPSAASVG